MPETPPDIAILILAAGQASRMRGTDKLLEPVDGVPLIRRQVLVALASGLPIWVALAPDRPLRRAALQGLGATLTLVADAGSGLSHSIRAGNAAIPARHALMLWLADLPDIETADLVRLADAARTAPDAVVRATTAAGKPGHPVLLPPRLRAELAGLSGDTGARDLLARHAAETLFVALPGTRALTDLDTPEDWAQWRAKQTP